MEKQAKSIKWVEMTDVISNVYGETTWTPLWRYDVLETGDSSTIGYEEEILRVRTLFAPLENKERLVRGHFLDFDPDGTYATIDCRNYCKLDVYYFDSNTGLVAGEYPVFGFYLPNGPDIEPFVSQDMIVALRLVRQGDEWVRPEECGIDVIRIERDKGSKIREIKIRTEILKDYLCARNMGLYIEEFRHRQVQTLQAPAISWPKCHGYDERFCEHGHYIWKGWVFEHSNSDDWSEPFTLKGDLSLPAFYRVEGQLWKQYWICAGIGSPRIGGDSHSHEFVVSPNGDKHEISTLEDDEYGHVYLFFDPLIISHLQDTAGVELEWVSRDVFRVGFPSHGKFLCGISAKGNIFVISSDIARLEDWAQNLWRRENIRPEDLVDYQTHELFQNQMMCEFLHAAESPEQIFARLADELGVVFKKRTGVELWQDIDTSKEAVKRVSRFVSRNSRGLVELSKYILEALSERMSSPNLKKYIADDKATKDLKSIQLFEMALSKLDASLNAPEHVRFIRNINAIRQIDSHLMSRSEAAKRLRKVNLPEDASPFEQGAQLIEYTNIGIAAVIKLLKGESS